MARVQNVVFSWPFGPQHEEAPWSLLKIVGEVLGRCHRQTFCLYAAKMGISKPHHMLNLARMVDRGRVLVIDVKIDCATESGSGGEGYLLDFGFDGL